MQCPIDHVDLLITDREGIEIDYCPKCRGVWLDRAELDKIIERSTGGNRDRRDAGRSDDRRNQNDDEEGGFLGNIFGGLGGRDDD